MSDYYCPNCGADLGDQTGFCPENGYWTCTECGQFLTDPNDFDLGSQYDGVGWFCDSCGAYLNKQFGFNDWCGTWTCTECGHENLISDDQIYGSKEEYQSSSSYHENGNDNDDGFGYGEEWKYDNPQRCKCCGRLLNKQKDFNEWMTFHVCEKCGYYNDLTNEESDDDTTENKPEDKDTKSTEKESRNYRTNYSFHSNNNKQNAESVNIGRTEEPIYSKPTYEQIMAGIKKMAVVALALVLAGIAVFIWNIYQDYKNSIEIGISSEYALGQDYKTVVRTLEKNGFTDIHELPVYDLSYDEIDEENKICRIEINGKGKFDKDDKAPYDTRVDISYHVLMNIKIPLSSKEAKKMNYEDLVSMLEESGFVNIEIDKDTDLITGWITKDGSVETVSVDGETKFSKESEYRPDVKIVVTYHTFKDK